ncbi:cyclin-dependent kinase 11B-like isoform X2 [Argiope bruennichi]|uniref:cyclin-dependent kinase 11B-like isoform X2 n=1 Tax=Argiope bruennichi TaxID=94029 RepID=UPI00249546AA|nr:cyclin-dependent kinase 11B-like isoform X2 [Argiope bruennichi]
MAYHDNLRTIPLTGTASESEEDGEIVKDIDMKELPTINEEDHESESSKDEGDDSLDIKPPQASIKSRDTRRDDRKKSRHSRKHDSRRRDHHRSHDRNSRREGRTWQTEPGRKDRDADNRTVRYRDDGSRSKERDYRKNMDVRDLSDIRDIREIRVKKDVRDSRDRSSDKSKDERHLERLEEKKMEWRKKRLLFIEKQREQDREPMDRSWAYREDSQSSGRDLREKLREKERIQQEKERRLERFRTSPKEQDEIPSENIEKDKKALPLAFMEEEPMDYEEDKEVEEEEESDQQSEEKEEENEKDDTESDTESSGSDTEGSSHNSKGEEEEEEEEEEAAVEETSEEGEVKKEAEPEKSTSPVKEEVPTPAPEPAPYKPAIQGCRSVEEFHCLNRIEEGTYGVVYRARDKRTDEIVALKRLKMEKEKEGFPITSLREINTLLKAQHPNIVTVREIVVGSNMDKIYIVMDYVEHDLKSLMETMKQPFLVGEVKTLMLQLLCAVAHLHDNWILHRDLKTSNLLLSHKGVLKVGDFGLAREYGSPLKPYTPVVVTLWYRAPELLLGAKQYSTPIDMWSVGCIFGELLTMKPLFPGKSEIDQLNRIFKDLGTPSEKIWHGYSELPLVKKVTFTEYPYNNLRSRFGHNFTDLGFDLLNRFLTYNPSRRITAEDASKHEFFNEKPKPVSPNMFPTWPAKSEQGHRKAQSSPKPPSGGKQYARQMGEADDEGLMAAAGFHMAGAQEGHSAKGAGFSLKF